MKIDTKEILRKIPSAIKETLDTILFVLIAVIVIRFFIGELRWIPSGSMHPTLIEGDRLFVENSQNRLGNQPGVTYLFLSAGWTFKKDFFSIISRLTGILCKDIAFIKRIVGMPGDKLEIKMEEDGNYFVYINDNKLNEPYILSKSDWMPCRDDMYCGPFIVPEGN